MTSGEISVILYGELPTYINIKKRSCKTSCKIILRSRQIDTLVLSGISTSGVILSTLREAADKDYGLIVLSDACLDADPEVHWVLMEKVFPRQADVLTVDEWMAILTAARLKIG